MASRHSFYAPMMNGHRPSPIRKQIGRFSQAIRIVCPEDFRLHGFAVRKSFSVGICN